MFLMINDFCFIHNIFLFMLSDKRCSCNCIHPNRHQINFSYSVLSFRHMYSCSLYPVWLCWPVSYKRAMGDLGCPSRQTHLFAKTAQEELGGSALWTMQNCAGFGNLSGRETQPGVQPRDSSVNNAELRQ